MVRGKAVAVSLCCLVVGLGAAAGVAEASGPAAHARAKAAAAEPKVDMVCANASIAFWAPVIVAAKAAAKVAHVQLSYTGVGSSNLTGPAMATILQAAVNQKPAVLIYCNYFPSAEDPIIKAAVKSGIPAIAVNSVQDWQQDGALDAFTENNEAAGVAAGQDMLQAGVKHPLCIDDVPTDPTIASRCTGFAKAFAAKGIKVKTINLSNASENPTAILSDTKGALASNPSADGLMMLGPIQGVAGVQAVQQSGKTGKVKVGAFDLSTDVLHDIKKGSMLFTIWQEPYLQGYLPVITAGQYAKYGMAASGEIGTGPVVVTKTNIKKVLAVNAAGLA